MSRTKIVCTLGPSSGEYEAVEAMIVAGMDVARINFSHGDYKTHERYLSLVREASENVDAPVCILGDLPGPKIRLGKFAEEPTYLTKGQRFILTTRKVMGSSEEASVQLDDLPLYVEVGSTVYLADGMVKLRVMEKTEDSLVCDVAEGGKVSSGKGVNIPTLSADFPSLTEADMEHLEFALQNDFDVIALSFVRRPMDIQYIRDIVHKRGGGQLLAAKIEKREAVANLDGIIGSSDSVMVARGDLGVEMGIENVPALQREIILQCNKRGLPVITATQMLLSMVESPTPTRAEVSDVANAIRDGTDAVMLSEETAVGEHPVEAVETASRIASITERSLPYSEILASRRSSIGQETDDAMSYAACEVAIRLGAVAIIAPTRSGSTARRVARFRPPLPIIALTTRETVARQLMLSWGIQPRLIEEMKNHNELFSEAETAARELGLTGNGDTVVIVAGDPASPSGTTDLLKVQTVAKRSA